MATRNSISFLINGKKYVVRGDELSSQFRLIDFLRERAHLVGTKVMCREGACGICAVIYSDAHSRAPVSIHACLVPIYMCDGWSITTIEGLGSERQGYHPIQKVLAERNGSQCGFCSPGVVMAMCGAMQKQHKLTKQEVESCFDGTVCRCTGYRPIMDAMKDCVDIEDLPSCYNCPQNSTLDYQDSAPMIFDAEGETWFNPSSEAQLSSLILKYSHSGTLVAGHTGIRHLGSDTRHSIFIDLNRIESLRVVAVSEASVKVGCRVSLTELQIVFRQVATSQGFKYLEIMASHLKKTANPLVRNVASWAGNLMLKYADTTFASDVFTLFVAAQVQLIIRDCRTNHDVICSMDQFLGLDMTYCYIAAAVFPSQPHFQLISYKIMPKQTNSYAYLNMAFFVSLDERQAIQNRPSLVYGGLGSSFVHAARAEVYLTGKSLLDTHTLQGALAYLDQDIADSWKGTNLPSQHKSSLAKCLLYKAFLNLIGDTLPTSLRSGGQELTRPAISSGVQEYQTMPEKWPLTQGISKVNSVKQTSGEAQFIGDMPYAVNQLHAVFVKSTIGSGRIVSIDIMEAIRMPGVVRVLVAKDIPGVNEAVNLGASEMLLCDDSVHYFGQPIAIVVAESETEALRARIKVKVEYCDVTKPILSINDAIQANSFHPKPDADLTVGDVQGALLSADNMITGSVETGEQYHMHMETQVCVSVPVEGKLVVYSATQSAVMCKESIAKLLGLTSNCIEVQVRRIGGGFGAKMFRSFFVSGAASLAAFCTNRPVRMCLSLNDNMEILGRRQPFRIDYKVAVAKDLMLKGIDAVIYQNCGWQTNENQAQEIIRFMDNAYNCPNWRIRVLNCRTNQPNHAYTRSPGTMTACFFMEQIMDHMAQRLLVSPESLREANLYHTGMKTILGQQLDICSVHSQWESLKKSASFDQRLQEVQMFNMSNRWRKKGLSIIPMKYGVRFYSIAYFKVHVMINRDGGSISIMHGGVEMGQGIDTKVIQVAARTLGVPIESIQVHPMSATVNHHSAGTGASIASDLNCYGVAKACEVLKMRMSRIKGKLAADISWPQLVAACFQQGVDLAAEYYVDPAALTTASPFLYYTWGIMCSEVELDILTSNYVINRVDLSYDCGESLSPAIDLGQIEGAVVMGIGYLLTEEVKYDQQTGQCLSNNMSVYHVPQRGDIPVDFRVTLLKDQPNPLFHLRSKVVGEPPMLLSCSVFLALQRAIAAARASSGDTAPVILDAPLTVEKVHESCQLESSSFYIDIKHEELNNNNNNTSNKET